MRKTTKISAALLCLIGATFAQAQMPNNVPSCYSANGLTAPKTNDAAIFVLIDQTTPLDDSLRTSAEKNAYGFLLKNSGEFAVVQFSSFAQGHYMSVTGSGVVEPPIPESDRPSINVPKLEKFDACLRDQKAYAGRMLYKLMNRSIVSATDQLARSDIMASLKELSVAVRESTANRKVVFIISDMLENSSISSFYSASGVRNINPVTEMSKAVDGGMIGDFRGASVYVMGAGLVSENGKKNGVYRDPKTMNNLEAFWREYFIKSSARVVEFGKPSMMGVIQLIQ